MNNENSNMMYCTNCGAQISKLAYVCTKCGVLTKMPQHSDQQDVGLNILAFFIPIAGIILWSTTKEKTPIKARGMLNWAMAGFTLNVVWAMFVITMALVSASA